MCIATKASCYISNKGSQNYVDLQIFKQKKINHYFINYKNIEYEQGQNKFIPNLSIFDMLFFCGQEKTENIVKNTNNLEVSKNYEKL